MYEEFNPLLRPMLLEKVRWPLERIENSDVEPRTILPSMGYTGPISIITGEIIISILASNLVYEGKAFMKA